MCEQVLCDNLQGYSDERWVQEYTYGLFKMYSKNHHNIVKKKKN